MHKTCQTSWVSFTQMKAGGQSRSVATHLSDAYSRETLDARSRCPRAVVRDFGPSALAGGPKTADPEACMAVWLVVVSIASCEALDTRSKERSVCSVDFASVDEVFDPTGQEVVGTSLASLLPWLLPGLAEATGVDWFAAGRAALAVPARGAGGSDLATLGMVQVATKGRCGAAPRCTTSAKEALSANEELQRLSDTRWACQIMACTAAMKSFPAILVCLSEVIATNSRRATEARGLLEQMNFSFLFHLRLFTKLLSRLKVFSDILQSKDCNLSQACLMAHTVIDELSEIRNSQSAFDTVWEQTCTISEENGVPQWEKQRTKRLPLHLEQFVLSEGRPVEEESPNSKETFRVKVFLPVLDHLIVELTRRFAENNDVLCGVSALPPQSENFMDVSLLKPFAEHYACDINSVEVE
ncbi:hypothetical protein HPB51_005537 [Rhipicephalus microplus]|uniref:Uncharacterized protein n=1 Tax=Rhipicephalus microplus TaxID=6941 RepID=A0A9J6EXZ2_RHIMP|nr:hypothetical protein HPB51_005537 [Rhipicephalus microplus]